MDQIEARDTAGQTPPVTCQEQMDHAREAPVHIQSGAAPSPCPGPLPGNCDGSLHASRGPRNATSAAAQASASYPHGGGVGPVPYHDAQSDPPFALLNGVMYALSLLRNPGEPLRLQGPLLRFLVSG
jgi:hypothetical protein